MKIENENKMFEHIPKSKFYWETYPELKGETCVCVKNKGKKRKETTRIYKINPHPGNS